MKYILLFLFTIVLYGCSNHIEEAPHNYPIAPASEIIHRNLIISESSSLKSSNNPYGFSQATGIWDRELDLDRLVHNYEFTGYTVKVKRAWIIDDSDPNGGYYTDLEFENIDLTDHDIEFETSGDFEVEVKHP